MDKNKTLGVAGSLAILLFAIVIWASLSVYYSEPDVIVSPEKQVVVKEGFSGSNKPVITSHKEFTGHNKGIVVSPEKPKVISGYSKPPLKDIKPAKAPYLAPPKFPSVIMTIDGHKYNCIPE